MSVGSWMEKNPWKSFWLAGAAIAGVVEVMKPKSSLNGYGRIYTESNPTGVDMSRSTIGVPPKDWTGSWGLDASDFIGSRTPDPRGFKLDIPGVVNIHGVPVGGAPPPSALDRATTWVKANPLLAAGIGVGGYMLVRRKR